MTEFEEGNVVLVDLRSKRYYELNETAAMIWNGLQASHTEGQIAESMCAAFVVDHEKALHSVRATVELFRSHRLVFGSLDPG